MYYYFYLALQSRYSIINHHQECLFVVVSSKSNQDQCPRIIAAVKKQIIIVRYNGVDIVKVAT